MMFIASSAGEQHPSAPVAIPKDDRTAAYLRRKQRQVLQLVERSHSPLEHDFLFAYLDWLWETYFKAEYPDREAFRHQVSIDVGHVKIRRLRMRADYLERLAVLARETGWVDLEIPKSWSFSKAAFEEFHDLTKRVGEWGKDRSGIGLDEWRAKHPRFREA